MKSKKKIAAVAVSLATVMALGSLAGCNAIKTTDTTKNLAQTVAEVNITDSVYFDEEFGNTWKDVVSTASISKRQVIASYISNYSYLSQYGMSQTESFKIICNSLVNRAVFIQYAQLYFLKNGCANEDGTTTYYDKNEYLAAIENAEAKAKEDSKKSQTMVELEKDIAAMGYFLTEEEIDKVIFGLRTSFNTAIDNKEKDIIKEEEDNTEYETNVRTTPNGIDAEKDDFCDTDYRIYTATGKQAEICGTYEALDNSSPTTRMKAYNRYLADLRTNDLLSAGEDTSDIEKLQYYSYELKTAYETALINKINDCYLALATKSIDEAYVDRVYKSKLKEQLDSYSKSATAIESDMDKVSDTNFLLTSPSTTDVNYGFVINILLPFSSKQSDKLSKADQDYGDERGNKFVTRADLLKNILATDQRGSWFTGETNYSFDASKAENAYTGGNANRNWLFFENSIIGDTTRYDAVPNYYGMYTYNGEYDEESRVYTPNKIDIDGFVAEMEGYLKFVLGENALTDIEDRSGIYFGQKSYYKDDQEIDLPDIDYAKFVYRSGKIDWENLENGEAFNANRMFVAGSNENKAFSVINELSFAYNTDTAGLNSYLGYAVTANKTNFVSEFEYAAQEAVKAGAGSYYIVPSDYGWHIIYCTFSFADAENGRPYHFVWEERDKEGTFSYLFYESLKANAFDTYSSNRRTKITNAYSDCGKVYTDRLSN